jgi:hypothetical protein
MTGEVKDTRRTDGFFNKLEVELKLLGDVLSDAKGLRITVAKAVDETGRDLVDPKTAETEFKEVDSSQGGTIKVEIQLKNPARMANAVKEITGTVELFVPKRDPASTVAVPSFLRNAGKPIVSPTLKAAGIEIIAWTKEQYEARKKIEEEKQKRAEAERRIPGAKQEGEDIGDALAQGLTKMFGGLLSSFAEMNENSIAFQISDESSKLVGIEFEDAAGKPISRGGRMTIGGQPRTQIYEFENKLPDTTRIKLFVLTARSMTKVPFKLLDVPLP